MTKKTSWKNTLLARLYREKDRETCHDLFIFFLILCLRSLVTLQISKSYAITYPLQV